jgi:hypothetical protein
MPFVHVLLASYQERATNANDTRGVCRHAGGVHGDQVNRMGQSRQPASTGVGAGRGLRTGFWERLGAWDPLPTSTAARPCESSISPEVRRDPRLFDNEHYVK